MEVILMRHGRAAERAAFVGRDEERPLTAEGIKRLRQALPGLVDVVPRLDRVVTSPLLRARQTAEVVAESYSVPLTELAALAPGGGPPATTHWLAAQHDKVLLLVGHEPDLGRLASWYLTGSDESFVPLKKGAICAIRFMGKPAAARGELRLLLTSRQLRRIAG
ncbi:MAG TPA: phosphohistidine phosphatase SixA [Gammaproteobacteria bacterium]